MKKGEFNTPIREKYIYRDKHSKKNPKLKKNTPLTCKSAILK